MAAPHNQNQLPKATDMPEGYFGFTSEMMPNILQSTRVIIFHGVFVFSGKDNVSTRDLFPVQLNSGR